MTKNTTILIIKKGIVEIEQLPKGSNLIIKDYDIENGVNKDDDLCEGECPYVKRVFIG